MEVRGHTPVPTTGGLLLEAGRMTPGSFLTREVGGWPPTFPEGCCGVAPRRSSWQGGLSQPHPPAPKSPSYEPRLYVAGLWMESTSPRVAGVQGQRPSETQTTRTVREASPQCAGPGASLDLLFEPMSQTSVSKAAVVAVGAPGRKGRCRRGSRGRAGTPPTDLEAHSPQVLSSLRGHVSSPLIHPEKRGRPRAPESLNVAVFWAAAPCSTQKLA